MSIRSRLTVGFVVVIVLANAVFAFVTVHYVSAVILGEVQTRVRLDLNSARDVYEDEIEDMARVLRAFSLRDSLATRILEDGPAGLGDTLVRLKRENDMDMLSLVGKDGTVIFRAHAPDSHGDSVSDIPVVAQALEEGQPSSGTFLVGMEMLRREGESLAERARQEVLDTPGARPGKKTVLSEGMVLGAAVPLRVGSDGGEVAAALYGAKLVNGRYVLVDRVKDEVFQGQTHEGKDIGTATIFQDDVRISTNVRNRDGSRAIGTRLSEEVYDEVIEQGRNWERRAFVVNDWYITAYAPIRDLDDEVIGALYVGLLEEPFTRPEQVIILFFLVVMGITAVVVLGALNFLTKRTLEPIPPIVAMCKKIMAGDLTARVGIRPGGEMGVLCEAVDRMADAVSQREAMLQQTTRQQLGQSEKLASIGRLAAGIAHEINNPLTGVLTFAHLLKERKDAPPGSHGDLDVIIRETTRVREIVRGLLDFARQSAPAKEQLDINDVIRRTMQLLRSQKDFRKITIEESLDSKLPRVLGDKNQLQQVFLNLSLNALEAMPEGGLLRVETNVEHDRVRIVFADTGIGIKEQDLEQIFDPFFTTKPVGKGTGLGLSVSYGTIQQHGGSIDVESEEGRGTIFTILLPLNGREDSGSVTRRET